MTAITFDTLMYAKKLKEAGVPEKQAEIQAEALRDIIENNLATKVDIETMRDKLETKITELEYKIIIKMGIMLVAAISILAAIIKL
jgi:hypothetical protein